MIDNVNSESISPVNVTDDCEACLNHWIALYTRPRSEKKVASILASLGIESYLPVQRQMRQWSDRKKLIDVVVIPMVIFVYTSREKIEQITRYNLILRPFKMPGSKEISIIPHDQIKKLKYILGQTKIPVEFNPNIFHIHQNVRIIRGPLIGLLGEVLNPMEDSADVLILIEGLGGVKLTTNKSNLEAISY